MCKIRVGGKEGRDIVREGWLCEWKIKVGVKVCVCCVWYN